jgi:hypothetical protein
MKKISDRFSKKVLFLDHQNNFSLGSTSTTFTIWHYKKDKKTPNGVEFKTKIKLEEHFWFWRRFPKMMSLLPRSVKFAARANVHISKCLSKVKKFINDDHQDNNIVFWFNLAS